MSSFVADVLLPILLVLSLLGSFGLTIYGLKGKWYRSTNIPVFWSCCVFMFFYSIICSSDAAYNSPSTKITAVEDERLKGEYLTTSTSKIWTRVQIASFGIRSKLSLVPKVIGPTTVSYSVLLVPDGHQLEEVLLNAVTESEPRRFITVRKVENVTRTPTNLFRFIFGPEQTTRVTIVVIGGTMTVSGLLKKEVKM